MAIVTERLKELVQHFGLRGGRLRSDWQVLVELDRAADEQMDTDARLARAAQPAARFFVWSAPAVTLGWKQPRPAWLRALGGGPAVARVERPTAGGVALHGSDVSVSLVVPRGLGLPLDLIMRTVGASAVELCRSFGVEAAAVSAGGRGERIVHCLAEPSPYAVTASGRKLAGFALRRFPQSWLIQGSLLVAPIPARLADAMDPGTREAFRARAVDLSSVAPAPVAPAEAARRWAEGWVQWWDEGLIEQLAGCAA